MTDIMEVEKSKCLAIVALAKKMNLKIERLEDLGEANVSNFLTQCCGLLLNDELEVIQKEVLDPDIGIAGIDIPNFIVDAVVPNRVWGAAIAFGIYNNIFKPSVNSVTGLPYSLYRASYAAVAKMKQNNIKLSSPETIRGFHTDGLTIGSEIAIPKYISLYNIIINYRKPGNFHWVPFRKWEEFNIYAGRVGVNIPYRIALTPSVVTMPGDRDVVLNDKTVRVPIFNQKEGMEPIMFFNGEVLGPVDEMAVNSDLIARMSRSISERSERISIPQKIRRLIVVNNQLGLHARDVLEDPISKSKITRSLMRSLSADSIGVGRDTYVG